MKIKINNSAKRVLSLVLAFAMLVGCLFTANVGVNINASAETTTDYSTWNIQYWDGTADSTFATGTGTIDDPFIITNAQELNWVATVSGNASTTMYYKVDANIDAFIMQPEATVTDLGGPSAFIEISSAEETTKLFEETAVEKSATLKNWEANGGNVFNGDFDGSGVPIYGVYNNASAKNRENCGFFPALDGGGSDTDYTSVETDTEGIKIENLVIRNSYFKGFRRVAIIAGTSWYQGEGTAKVLGLVTLSACEVSNCFVVGQDLVESNSTITKTNATNRIEEMGVLLGSFSHEVAHVEKCLVYGNSTEYRDYNDDDKTTYTVVGGNNFNRTFASNGKNETSKLYGTLTKSIIIGTAVAGLAGYDETYVSNNYTFYNIETISGAAAMVWAENLAWGTDWFAVEGGLPTPINPGEGNYLDVSAKPSHVYSCGSGTKEDPYIIRTADQLYQMVNEQSYSGTYTDTHTDYSTDTPTQKSTTSYYSKYYKVADDVKSLYINKAETQAEIVALVEGGSYNTWAPTESFFAGNFDGNGVTIYGMVSKTGKGFVNKIDGTHAAIKNVHFKAAYVDGGDNRAAVVTTSFGTYGHGYKASAEATSTTYFNRTTDPNGEDVNRFLIANVVVTESYIHSNLGTTGDYVATAGGIITFTETPPWLNLLNCFFDGVSSTLTDGVGTTAGANPASAKAGIASMAPEGQTNRWNISNCISINEYPVSMKTGGKYTRFDATAGGGACEISNMYGPVNNNIDTTAYPKFSAVIALGTKDTYTLSDAPLLDWAYTWDLVKVSDTRTAIPMVVGLANEEAGISYSQLIADQFGNIGANEGNGVPGLNGRYGWQHLLSGTGTKDDPYLITNALELARAVGCGASRAGQPLHYKLTCDIDLSGSTWISQESVESNYHYVPFIGTIDGAGYAIYGLAATDATAAGFIPVLDGGTVKNLHFRNCYAGSAVTAGIIAGQVNSGTITGCSVEGSKTVGSSNHITGNWGFANVTNSYIYFDGTATYVLEPSTPNTTVGVEAVTDLYSADHTDAVWYKGPDGIARLVNYAKAHVITDVDADGLVEDTFVAGDIVALRNHLLGRPDYANIYGDVSRNGKVNISDLAILRRRMASDYNKLTDGFWRNVELGKVAIYYDENDNYDFARRLQLYLETVVPGQSIIKYAATDAALTLYGDVVPGTVRKDIDSSDADTYVNIKTDTTLTYDKYKIEYDSEKLILTISGGSFTAVEEAVNEFIKNTQEIGTTMTVYTTNDVKSILDTADATDTGPKHYKSSKTVWDGTKDVTVYYAWGDEFDGDGDDSTKDSFSTDNWQIRNYKYEPEGNVGPTQLSEANDDTRYLNLESPTVDSIPDLWEVVDGKLRIWRGVNLNATDLSDLSDADKAAFNNKTYTWGYKGVEFTLDDEGKSDFGRYIDNQDVFIDPGLIQTSKTMLFKQGYSEMRAALPHDGHAFPAWWFMTGYGNKSTKNLENHQLYGKIYKLNNATNNSVTPWDGSTMDMNPLDLTTYKYQMPQAFLEFDIVEFMQAQSGYDSTYFTFIETGRTAKSIGDYRDFIQLTVHKYYNQHVTDGKLYLPDWSTGSYVNGYNGMAQTDFVNTASSGNDGTTFIHNYWPDRTEAPYKGTVTYDTWYGDTESTTSASYSVSAAYENASSLPSDHTLTSSSRPNDMYTYGFYWTVNGSTYDLYVYVDFNNDGNMASNEVVFHIDATNGHKYDDPTWGTAPEKATTTGLSGSDAAVWNQYAYMLIDNAFYTCNPAGTFSGTTENTGTVTMFTDLLTQDNTWETTTFDLEYVRVYQADGRRDLVTPDTEAFNTGNHFGY